MLRKVLLISASTVFVSSFILLNRIARPNVNQLNDSNNNNLPSVSSSQDQFKKLISSRIDFLNKAVIAGTLGTFLPKVVHADAPPSAETPSSSNTATFITTASGLKYQDLKVGDGASPLPGDTVRVHYTGWLDDFNGEKKFDSSYDRRSPLVFKAGVRQVIAGWDEALLTDFKVGGKRNVIIPADLGYGQRGAGGVIPPGATLYFVMELVGIGAR